MTVVINLHLKAKNQKNYDALYKSLKAMLPDTASYDGARLISCSADAENMTFIVHQIWESLNHQQTYLGWRQERGDVDTLVSMLGEPPRFIQHEHLVY